MTQGPTQKHPRPAHPVPAAEATRFNTLVAGGRSFAFTWAGQPAELSFTNAATAAHVAGHLRVQLGEHRLDLGYSRLPDPAQLGVDFAGVEIAALPDELRLGLVETCLEDALGALHQQGANLEITGWSPAGPRPAAQIGWALTRAGQPFLAGTVHGEAAALDHLAALAGRSAPKPQRRADSVPMPLTVTVAHLTLSLEALRTLHPGDVLLPALSAADWADGHCEVWCGAQRLGTAERQKQTVKIQAMKPAPVAPSSPAPAAPLSVDALPVQLGFDVGQLELSVGQLRTVAEGYTFELPATAERVVTIRANGRAIGHGELVDLGDKLGVRIVSWSLA